MDIDKKKIHAAIRSVLERQKEIKAKNKRYREDYRFRGLSYEMTVLCSLLAQAKGKTHIKKLTKRFGDYGFLKPVDPFTLKHQEKLFGRAKRIIDNLSEKVKVKAIIK